MRLYTKDENKSVDVGTSSIWYSLYSTTMVCLSDSIKERVPLALEFLKTGNCFADDIEEMTKQLEVIYNQLTLISPKKAILDLKNPDVPPPWRNHISADVTSCADLYTTADGEDLFSEVFELLKYAEETKASVFAG